MKRHTRLALMLAAGGALIICTIKVMTATDTRPQDAQVKEGSDPIEPPAASQHRGRFQSPDGLRAIHIYTFDPGALGVAVLWVFEEVEGGLQFISKGQIMTDRDFQNFQWYDGHKLKLTYLPPRGSMGRPWPTVCSEAKGQRTSPCLN